MNEIDLERALNDPAGLFGHPMWCFTTPPSPRSRKSGS